MKKNKSLFAAIIITGIIALTGCSNKKDITIDVNLLADNLKEGIEFQDEMTEMDGELFSMVYPAIEEADVVNKKIYLSTGATAEEIAVLEGKDTESADRIEVGLKDRIESEKANFESYIPEEMKKLDNPVLEKKGKYVILCISNENDKANEIIDKAQ